jgi:hypothetical protein
MEPRYTGSYILRPGNNGAAVEIGLTFVGQGKEAVHRVAEFGKSFSPVAADVRRLTSRSESPHFGSEWSLVTSAATFLRRGNIGADVEVGPTLIKKSIRFPGCSFLILDFALG